MREQPGRDQVCPGRPTDDQRDRSDCPEGGHRNRLERQAADWMRRSAQEAIGGEQGREAKKDAGRVKGADPDLAGSNDDERSEESGHAADGLHKTAAPRYTSPDAARIAVSSPPLGMSSAIKPAKPMPANAGHQFNEFHHPRAGFTPGKGWDPAVCACRDWFSFRSFNLHSHSETRVQVSHVELPPFIMELFIRDHAQRLVRPLPKSSLLYQARTVGSPNRTTIPPGLRGTLEPTQA